MFGSENGIFRNRDLLRSDSKSDEVLDRERVLQQFQTALQPIVHGETPDNILVYGHSGLGKTTVTKYVVQQLHETTDTEIEDVYVNCRTMDSAAEILSTVDEQLVRLVDGSHSSEVVAERILEAVDWLPEVVVFVFDEIGKVSDMNTFLDKLKIIQSNSEKNMSYITICDDLKYTEYIPKTYAETLFENRVRFPGYEAETLQSILESHVESAFQEEVLRPNALSRCVAYAVQEGGSCRVALDLLRQAGDRARSQNDTHVEQEHVDEVRGKQMEERFISKIVNFREHEKMVLYALVTLDASESLPARSQSIYERYTDLCTKRNVDPRTIRTIRKFLSDFSMENIVSVKEHYTADGNYREYVLNPHLDLLVEALRDFILDTGLHESIHHLLGDSQYHDDQSSLPDHVFRTHRNE